MSSLRSASVVGLFVALAWYAPAARAQLIVTTDDSVSAGVAAPPTPLSPGVNLGFGGQIGVNGTPVQMAWDSDVNGRIGFGLIGGACTGVGANYDVAVVYIDPAPSATGFASTLTFTDVSIPEAAAVSAGGVVPGPNAAPLTFPSGFLAQYAIAFTNPPAGTAPRAFLFQLQAGAPHVVTPLIAVQPGGPGTCGLLAVAGLTLGQIGLNPGDSFGWFATLINAQNGFRADEFHGATVPPGNIGAAPYVMGGADGNVFTTIGRIRINEVDADGPSTDTVEFIELFGPPNARLDGTVVVAFDGSSDASYYLIPAGVPTDPRGIDLDGYATDASGYFVLGNAAIAAASITFPDNRLQNGADAVALYLDDASSFPSTATPVTATNLVDALVYDTSDADDAGLLGVLTPGEAQINENGTSSGPTVSNQRCPNGAGLPLTTGTYQQHAPSPGEANICATCGNGTLEPGEVCDDGSANGTTACGCATSCTLPVVGTACGSAGTGGCDDDDTCDGSGACVDHVLASGTECRAVAGDCDVAETCTGTSAACPADAFLSMGTSCRAVAGDCDVAEACTGTGAACPVDGFVASGTECRATAGICDAAETCSGSSAACPADGFLASGTSCRAASGTCDVAETCTGSSASCPTDAFAASSTSCRAVAGDCDVAETCTGSSGACPADAFVASGTSCRATAGICDVAETCAGSSAACPTDAYASASTSCRPAAGACDSAETCTGSGVSCPVDALVTDGTSCADSTVCDGTEVCASGACVAGTALDCDDADACTADSCAEPGGCAHMAVTGCCNLDSECDDGDACTGDACDSSGHVCTSTPIAGCTDGGVVDTDGGVVDTDGGVVDTDGGVTDASLLIDSGAGVDAGAVVPRPRDDGCSCRIAGARSGGGALPWLALGLPALGLLRLRRRSRARRR